MPIKSASVNRIVCDAPFGQKFAVASKSLPQFYKGLIQEMYRYKICFLNCSNLSFVCLCLCVCGCVHVCVCVCVNVNVFLLRGMFFVSIACQFWWGLKISNP